MNKLRILLDGILLGIGAGLGYAASQVIIFLLLT